MFLEVGVWGEAPHIALLLFAEKQKGRFLEMPFKKIFEKITKVDKKLRFEVYYRIMAGTLP